MKMLVWLIKLFRNRNKPVELDYRFTNYLLDGEFNVTDIKVFTANSLYLMFKDLEDHGDIKITNKRCFIDNDGNRKCCDLTQIKYSIDSIDIATDFINQRAKMVELLRDKIKTILEFSYSKPYIYIDESQLDECFFVREINYSDMSLNFRFAIIISYYVCDGRSKF